MKLEDKELERIFDEGESSRVERKESLGGNAPKSIREAICAFANDLAASGTPGVVFVGVTDDGKPSGFVPNDEKLRQLADMKTDGRILPLPSMLVERRTVRNLDLAVVTVLPSDSPPVRMDGNIQIRIGPRKGTATAQDERLLNEKRRNSMLPYDIHPAPNMTVDDLNLRQFEDEYLQNAFSSETLAENQRSIEERLSALKMLTDTVENNATVMGCLVLGKYPRDIFPGSYVHFVRIAGKELSDPIIDEQEIDGTVSDIIRRTEEKLSSHVLTAVDITSEDKEFRTAAYPFRALQQIVRNAVMHRTYESTNAPIRIYWFLDRIEIHNPGGPFGQVTPENFGTPGITDYRNPNLAEALKVLGYVQRFGVGIAIAQRFLEEAGHPPLDFVVNENHVAVIIRGRAA